MPATINRAEIVLTLRLLANPMLGAQGISDSERQALSDAAAMLSTADRVDGCGCPGCERPAQ